MPQHAGQQPEDQLGWYMEGSAQEIADILMEFSQELRRGDVNVWKGQRELHLEPQGKLRLRVQAVVQNDGAEGLQLHLNWDGSSAARDLHSGANMGVPIGEQGDIGNPSPS